ncbi:MAG: ABC transporter substrate-binding protein [Planctomycetota bacterium]
MSHPALRSWLTPHASLRWGAPALLLLGSAPLVAAQAGNAAGTPVEASAAKDETPLFGGRVILHIPSMPENMSYPIENSAETRRMLYEVHETLLLEDWESTELVPNVAHTFYVEDLVILKPDASVEGAIDVQVHRALDQQIEGKERELVPAKAVYGDIADGGADWKITSDSPGSDFAGGISVPKDAVDRVEKGAVYTFALRDDVRWHESRVYEGDDLAKIKGQMLNADDVYFSWSIYSNPAVDCNEKRFQFEPISGCNVVDEHTVRFFGASQNAFTFKTLGRALTLLPSHIFNLADPDCPDHDPNASMAKQAEHINVNDHNKMWVGVGPYQITTHSQQWIEASRFVDESGKPAYFDVAKRPGYVDTIRWRYIPDDQAAMVALENGEVDFFQRVKPADYFGPRTNSDDFNEGFNKGYFYLGHYGYTGWNMYRPQLKELVVRKAIALAFDNESYLANQYKGLGRQTTGPVPYDSDGYPHDLEPLAYDPDLALEMLEDAGWYDRNGNDIADKDGVELEIEFLYPSGNDASKILGRTIQDSVKPLGIKINLASLEWATFLERMKQRKFDAVNLAWVPELESDPEQLWHSKWGLEEKLNTSNNSGVVDPNVDRMIAEIQREVNRPARMELWKKFHAYIYGEVQPYLFGFNVPRKFAISNRLGKIKHTPIDPGFIVRDWYFIDPSVPGTRPALSSL